MGEISCECTTWRMATAWTAVGIDTVTQLDLPSPTPRRSRSFSTPTTMPTLALALTARLWHQQQLQPLQQQQWHHRHQIVQLSMDLALERRACLSRMAHTGFPMMVASTGLRRSSMCQWCQTLCQHQKRQKMTKKTSFRPSLRFSAASFRQTFPIREQSALGLHQGGE